MSFAQQYLPQRWQDIDQIFEKRGAYGRFKELLLKENQLEAWYTFEQNAIKEALTDWCRQCNIELDLDDEPTATG